MKQLIKKIFRIQRFWLKYIFFPLVAAHKEQTKQHIKKIFRGLLVSLKYGFFLAVFYLVAEKIVPIWHSREWEFVEFLGYLFDGIVKYFTVERGYLIAGVLLILQVYVSNRRATAAEETAKAMQKTAELTESGNIAERFKNAIEHLGNESASIRLGGIYALHHIAQEVEEYRKRVFEILCAHIRETTTKPEYKILKDTSDGQVERTQPTIEIQSILNLLFIENQGKEIYTELKANLEDAYLHGARLQDAYLHGARLQKANLKKANLHNANLQVANLYNTNLKESWLTGANLQGALLSEANLQNAYLIDANLQNASLSSANLQNANLVNTDLQDAYLRGVDLRNVKHLKVEQLLVANTLFDAKLPDEMKEEIKQKKPALFNDPYAEQES